jgi:adenosylhomocysteine nucleosidase
MEVDGVDRVDLVDVVDLVDLVDWLSLIMIAVSFALPEESKGVVRALEGARRSGPAALPVIAGRLGGKEVIVVHSGMGRDSASARVGACLEEHAPSHWIACGFGGGLDPELRVGEIVVVRNYSEPGLLAAIASLPARRGDLVTTGEVIETAAQKRDLARRTGAMVVDMETAAIAPLCGARGIPMLAVRAISDTASEDLPVRAAVWFDMVAQRPRALALVLYLAAHPGRIGPFARFVRGVHLAGGRLTAFLLAALERLPAAGEGT